MPKDTRKPLNVGFHPDERASVDAAASAEGIGASTWIRQVALLAARNPQPKPKGKRRS